MTDQTSHKAVPPTALWPPSLTRPAALSAAILAGLAAFSVMPLDLWVSRLFFHEGRGFPAASNPWVTWLRYLLWGASLGMVAASIAGLGLATCGRSWLQVPARLWGFILALYVSGPTLLVEVVVKRLWGRARPDSVHEFGGPHSFSLPTEFVDACARNCSFVSGEVSGATVLGLSLLAISRHLGLRGPARSAMLVVALTLPLTATLLRVTAGRHFLSDAVMAVLFMLLLGHVLSRVLRVRH